MADDLDQLIRTAMKTLDDEVPSGYFEALPNQTIARLEGSSMQHGSSGTTESRDTVVTPPPVALEAGEAASRAQAREEDREDSGLHDIRNLAQSTKQRLSSRRITQSPPIADDVLASSSGSFKNIALPQPANMVSLPALDELPTKAEMDKAAEKAAKKAAKEARKSQDKMAAVAPAAAVDTPAVETRQAFSLPSQRQKRSKGPLIALVGTGLAAAAGAVIFMQLNQDKANEAAAPAASVPAADMTAAPPPARPAPTVEPIAPPPVEEAAAVPAEEPKQEAAAQIAADDNLVADDKAGAKKAPKATKGGKRADKDEAKPQKVDQVPDKVETKKATEAPKKASGDENEPSFDALLKEAGVTEKKPAKPVLDKKSLTGDDFKKGMAAVTPKAKGCYTGTQGTATVRLTIAPSGQVSKVSVGGEFAGKPEASCIESALRAATFPPWDGGPQSFSYAVLLSD